MGNLFRVLFGAAGLFTLSGCAGGVGDGGDVPTVKNFDPARYMGVWHEVARFENWFEKGMRAVKAEYSLNPDGTVSVVNSGVKGDGSKTSVRGEAYAPDKSDYSKLRVSFFWPFYGDYYILELDPDYQWALVGGRDKSYLWILARAPTLPAETLSAIKSKAAARGYDTGKFIFD